MKVTISPEQFRQLGDIRRDRPIKIDCIAR
jgi:hypothetical protein